MDFNVNFPETKKQKLERHDKELAEAKRQIRELQARIDRILLDRAPTAIRRPDGSWPPRPDTYMDRVNWS